MIKALNDVVSFLLELTMLAAFAYAGFHVGNHKAVHYMLGIGIPVLVVIFWSKKMAPKAKKRLPYPWVLIVAFLLFEASAVALYFSGKIKGSIILAIMALINTGLRFVFKDRGSERAKVK